MKYRGAKNHIFVPIIVLAFFCILSAFITVRAFSAEEIKSAGAAAYDRFIIKLKNEPDPMVINLADGDEMDDIMTAYSHDPAVEYVEPDFSYHASMIPSDSYFSNQWHLKKIKAVDGWDVIRESPDIVIAVIDSGVQINHPDLKDNIWINKKEIPGNKKDDDKNGFIDDVNGWDFVGNSSDPTPKFDEGYTEGGVLHGTVVAGVAAAAGNNAAGVTGVTWKSMIMPLRVLDGKGEGNTSKVVKAIDYAVANGADIINLSFVGFRYSRSLDDAIRRAYEAGVLVVAAAGNEQSGGDGYDIDQIPMYPACDDGMNGENMVIGVAALDTLDQKAHFSSYGSRCVDISAPGVSVFSTTVYAPDEFVEGHSLDKYYDGYWSGTSMAAPMVVGGLALLEQLSPDLSRDGVVSMLLDHTDNISRLNPNYIGKLGSGRMNIFLSAMYAKNGLERKETSLFVSPQSENSTTSRVSLFLTDGKLKSEFIPYGAGFRGGIKIAAAILEEDGHPDVITAPAAGFSGGIKVFDFHGKQKLEIQAFAASFRGGANVAAGDVNGDGSGEIIVAPASGDKPIVKVYSNTGKLIKQFLVFADSFRGGVNLAVGDVDGDGIEEIIVSPGRSGGPQVRVFKASGKLQSQFFAFDKGFRGGVNVTTADIAIGARGMRNRIIVAPASGGGPQVRIFNNNGVAESQFWAYSQSFRGGVNISAGDLDNDGFDEIVTGAGPGGGPHIRIFDKKSDLDNSFYSYEPSFTSGINIAVNN